MKDDYAPLEQRQMIEDLLQTYGMATDLGIILTTSEGKYVAGAAIRKMIIEDGEHVVSLLEEVLHEVINSPAAHLKGLKETIVYEELTPGAKSIVAPVKIFGRNAYYIWTKPVILIADKANIDMGIVKLPDELKRVIQRLLPNLPEHSYEDIEEKRLKIEKLAETIGYILGAESQSKLLGKRISQVESLIMGANQEEFFISNKLYTFLEASQLGDIFAFAKQYEPGAYKIEEAVGPSSAGLLGEVFRVGEGFLGQAALREQALQWDNVEVDPRTSYFTSRGIQGVQTVYTFPVRADGRMIGTLIAISLEMRKTADETLHKFEKMLASLVSSTIGNQISYIEVKKQLNRIKPVMDVARMIGSVPDSRSVLITLLDVSLSVLENSKAAIVVLQGEKTGKMRMVSRGMESKSMEATARYLRERYFVNDDQEELVPRIKQTDRHSSMVEIPMLYDHEVRAVLAVEISGRMEEEVNNELIPTLSVLGGLIIHSVYSQEERHHFKDTIITLLHGFTKSTSLRNYELTIKKRKIIQEFADSRQMNKEEKDLLGRVSLLTYTDPETLRMFPGLFEWEALIVEEYQALKDKITPPQEKGYSPEAQWIAAASYYAEKDLKGWITGLAHLDQELVNQFRVFVDNREVLEREVVLQRTASGEAEMRVNNKPDEEHLMKALAAEKGLSSRELEVLNLVVKAYSNKQIGHTLFISEHTVKNHLTSIFNKLGVSDRMQAVAYVYNKELHS